MRTQGPGVRVLSRIYRLGIEEELPKGGGGIRGHASPEIFSNDYALRCNLAHFETQF